MKKTLGILIPFGSLLLTSCGSSLPKNISQNDWNNNRQYVTLKTGVKMSYVEMGDSNGEVVILQHGMTDNSRSWSLAAPYFASQGYHVYIPDLRGQGHSSYMEGDYTLPLYARDLNAFCDAKNIDNAICVGHSLGSLTMQSFWMFYPERVNKVVLLSSAALYGYLDASLTAIYETQIKDLPAGGHVSDSFINAWYNCESEPVEEEIRGETFNTFISYMKEESKALTKEAWTNVIYGMIDTNYNSNVASRNLYNQIDKSKKCLILHGSTDTMAKTEYQEELCTLLSNGEEVSNVSYREYTGVGHNIQFVIPKQSSTDIVGWLKTGVLPDLPE